MPDAKELIGGILSNPRLAQSRAFSDRVYEDEPILFTGSQMRNFLPEKYRQMKELARPEFRDGDYRRITGTELFVRQARFMEHWEDDFPFKGAFKRYFPTYAMMNDQQLRGYFAWRTKVRKGVIEEASLSFAYVYVYELLNGIGAEGPQESFDKLYAFWQASRSLFSGLDTYVPNWLRDLAIYHGLPSSLFEKLVDLSFENALIALRQFEQAAVKGSDVPPAANAVASVWEAVCVLTPYGVQRPSFLLDNKAVSSQVVVHVLASLARHCATKRKKGLTESWFGQPQVSEHAMFPSAVFLDSPKHPDCRYDVNAVHSYTCNGGRWFALRRYKKALPSEDLGAILKAIELAMRADDPNETALLEAGLPKYQAVMVCDAVRAVRKAEVEKERRRVRIDRSSLAGIRQRAAGTREQLLTEEERTEASVPDEPDDLGNVALEPAGKVEPLPAGEAEPASSGVGEPNSVAEVGSAQNNATQTTPLVSIRPQVIEVDDASAERLNTPPSGSMPYALTADELSLLKALIAGEQRSAADEDFLADQINEKLLDLLGDTALEFGAEGLQVVDEYREDLEKVVDSCLSK